MKIAQLTDYLVMHYNDVNARHHTTFICGPSGIGKSDSIKQAAAILAEQYEKDEQPWAGVIDLRLSQCDVTDVRGVPSVVDGRTVWNIPEFFPKPGTRGLFLLEEITSAPPAMQAAAYQLALDRLHMPDGWMVVAAGNRQSDRGVTYTMASPLAARMGFVNVDAELDGFLQHAAAKGIRPEIMAFLSERPDLLHNFDKASAGQPFPNPRSWFRASDHMNMIGNNAGLRVEILTGDVGSEAAGLFESFMRVWEVMPKLDDIYRDPDSVQVPERLDVQHCVVMGIAATADEKTVANAFKYLDRIGKQELSTLCMKLLYKRCPAVNKTATFTKWAVANQDIWKA